MFFVKTAFLKKIRGGACNPRHSMAVVEWLLMCHRMKRMQTNEHRPLTSRRHEVPSHRGRPKEHAKH
jgi:hypothetical protein